MYHTLDGLPDPDLDAQFYAGVPFKRLIAWFIDITIILFLCAIAVIATFGLMLFFTAIIFFAVSFAYRGFMLSRYSATLGMMAVGIELRNGTGDKLNTAESIWHIAGHLMLFTFFLFNIFSMIMMLVNPRGQGLHDYFLGIAAINKPSEL